MPPVSHYPHHAREPHCNTVFNGTKDSIRSVFDIYDQVIAVKVKVPSKVYHIPKVPEVDLNGKEGKIKEYVAVWKGKHVTATFPYKIEFFETLEGRGDKHVKFFVHLKEEEFEYID